MLRAIEQRFIGDLTASERTVFRYGACWFFLVLCSYYVLRPIREQIGATYGVKNLSWLFAAVFCAMLVAIPLYSLLVAKFHRRTLVPAVYLFFIATLVIFWVAMSYGPDWARARYGDATAAEVDIWSARCLYIWTSVYGLFVVSFFWSVIGDMASASQGRRLFGAIFGCGTLGGLCGSQIARRLVGSIGVANLLLAPAALLLIGLMVYALLENSYRRHSTISDQAQTGKATGGNPFAGFTAVLRSRYLLAISGFGLFLATCGTTMYFQQSEIVNIAYASLPEMEAKNARTEYFADIDFYVNIVTLCFQWFIVGWLMRKLGLTFTLALLPVVYLIGIISLAVSPTLGVLAVVFVVGRSTEYGILNPSREVLFTSVSREDRYKAKSFIDTVVRRGGDSAVGQVYQGLRETAGLAMTTLSWLIVPLAVFWIGLAVFIGRENGRIVAADGEPPISSSD